MSKRSLVLVAGLGMSLTATAQAERPDFQVDGSVHVGQEVFPSLSDYYTSPAFQQSGARCASEQEPLPDAGLFAAADCSFTSTTIKPLYSADDPRELVIPVVFHVIKRTNGVGALPADLIKSQIDVLNEDFGAVAGSAGAPGTNTRIRFELARLDPAGHPTTGIQYITNDAYFADPGPNMPNPMKQALRWDTTRYLNIYTNDAKGALGYATFPQSSAGTAQDGVVLLWSTVGRPALGGPPYDLGRTGTHEVGHYLGLFHTFQGMCGNSSAPYTSGDLIADTNRERDPQYGCTPSVSSCTGAGMNPIENYMDYSDDSCMNRFTPEQMNRMRCAITSFRFVNTAPKAQFTHTASDLDVAFTNASTDAESALELLKIEWEFGDGTTSTEASPTHTYALEGTYTVQLEVLDPGSGTSTVTQSVVTVAPPPDGAGCCQAPDGDTTFLLCGIPVALVLLRRRRRRG